jgi:hypothetical protein
VLGPADADIPYIDSDGETPADDRGYTDLMGCLFPPVGSVTWRAPSYAPAVLQGAAGSPNGHRLLTRVQAWETVVRHVAVALCALEDTGLAGSSPHLRLETLARITGSWVTVLRALVGVEAPHLPRSVS